MTDQRIALKQLHDAYETASEIDYGWEGSEKFEQWRRRAETALKRLFGDESKYVQDFEDVEYYPSVFYSGMSDGQYAKSFRSGVSSARTIISSAVEEVETYGDIGSEVEVAEPKLSRKIFVVHGHDNAMKQTVARFVEQIDFAPIILHEQPSGGGTLIEKIENYSDVGYAIVLLSPDDEGRKASSGDELRPRARQNVILELGYFIGCLGRRHVLAIKREEVELPSDYDGVVYSSYDNNSWKMDMIKELKALGFEVDANAVF